MFECVETLLTQFSTMIPEFIGLSVVFHFINALLFQE